jgi:glycosyltransferase involved in cell wall biosynthesis
MVKVYHFHNGSYGGVLSVIKNLITFSEMKKFENHIIYTINKDLDGSFKKHNLNNVVSEQQFVYSGKWNFFYTCRKLAKLLPDNKAVIIAHDWLELGMVSNLGLTNPVIFYVHGAYDYYYDLATKHSAWIDNYITVAQHIADKLRTSLPERKDSIHYVRFPIPEINFNEKNDLSVIQVVFAGRCTDAKGYSLLPKIENELQRRNVNLIWHIVGEGSSDVINQHIWPTNSNVIFHGNIENDDLIKLLCKSHILLLPSLAEGMPVIVIEAMKAGVVPIVNNLEGGIQEIVKHDISGFLVSNNQVLHYANYVEQLYNDLALLNDISLNAKKIANKLFEPQQNIQEYDAIVDKSSAIVNNKTPIKIYGSRLDQPWLPNIIVKALRSI